MGKRPSVMEGMEDILREDGVGSVIGMRSSNSLVSRVG